MHSRARRAADSRSPIRFACVDPNLRRICVVRKDPNASAANSGTVIMQFPNLERQNLIVRPVWKSSSSTLLLPGLIKLIQAYDPNLQQRLRLLQIDRVEPFSEPPINRSQQLARFRRLALVARLSNLHREPRPTPPPRRRRSGHVASL